MGGEMQTAWRASRLNGALKRQVPGERRHVELYCDRPALAPRAPQAAERFVCAGRCLCTKIEVQTCEYQRRMCFPLALMRSMEEVVANGDIAEVVVMGRPSDGCRW